MLPSGEAGSPALMTLGHSTAPLPPQNQLHLCCPIVVRETHSPACYRLKGTGPALTHWNGLPVPSPGPHSSGCPDQVQAPLSQVKANTESLSIPCNADRGRRREIGKGRKHQEFTMVTKTRTGSLDSMAKRL